MSAREPILEQWIASTMQSYPSAAVPFLTGEGDPFRNPVGHALRASLAVLYDELRGDMDADRIATALDAIVHIRAVQDFTASQAVAFVFRLKPILREFASEADHVSQDQVSLDARIDQLALLAFDKYMQCREQLADIRVSEGRRRIRAPQEVG
jgi:RsbRD-like negative regulator of sigma factor